VFALYRDEAGEYFMNCELKKQYVKDTPQYVEPAQSHGSDDDFDDDEAPSVYSYKVMFYDSMDRMRRAYPEIKADSADEAWDKVVARWPYHFDVEFLGTEPLDMYRNRKRYERNARRARR
jgi:hypothetical protein